MAFIVSVVLNKLLSFHILFALLVVSNLCKITCFLVFILYFEFPIIGFPYFDTWKKNTKFKPSNKNRASTAPAAASPRHVCGEYWTTRYSTPKLHP